MEQGFMSWTFHPPLHCKANPELDEFYADDVMKVPRGDGDTDIPVDDRHDIEYELYISELIRRLDPDQRYFLPLSGAACELASDEVTKNFDDPTVERVGYFIPYGGSTLLTALEEATPVDTWLWLRHILEGIQLLASINLQHGDLHLQNIVVDPIGRLPRIIDFGGSELLEGEGNRDVKDLVYRYLWDAIPLIQRRFPDSKRLKRLQRILEGYVKTPIPLEGLITLLEE